MRRTAYNDQCPMSFIGTLVLNYQGREEKDIFMGSVRGVSQVEAHGVTLVLDCRGDTHGFRVPG